SLASLEMRSKFAVIPLRRFHVAPTNWPRSRQTVECQLINQTSRLLGLFRLLLDCAREQQELIEIPEKATSGLTWSPPFQWAAADFCSVNEPLTAAVSRV